MQEIKLFPVKKRKARITAFGKFVQAILLIILIIFILMIMNVQAVGTRGETSVGFRDYVMCEVLN